MSARPTRLDKAVIVEAVEALWPRIVDWSNGELEHDDVGVKYDLARALQSYSLDGFYLAKQLDDDGWSDIDAQLVDILDGASSCIYSAHRKAVAAWVKTQPDIRALPIGTKVTSGRVTEGGVGIIAKIDETYAEYTVRFPDLGHVGTGNGTYGTILCFDEVTAVDEVTQ